MSFQADDYEYERDPDAYMEKHLGTDSYSMDAFGFLANALDGKEGDRGSSFPRSDAEDFSRGLRFVPGEVTMARRRGERVDFVQNCFNQCCWYWQFQDGSRNYYFESIDFAIHGKEKCELCGNPHTTGLHTSAEESAKIDQIRKG